MSRVSLVSQLASCLKPGVIYAKDMTGLDMEFWVLTALHPGLDSLLPPYMYQQENLPSVYSWAGVTMGDVSQAFRGAENSYVSPLMCFLAFSQASTNTAFSTTFSVMAQPNSLLLCCFHFPQEIHISSGRVRCFFPNLHCSQVDPIPPLQHVGSHCLSHQWHASCYVLFPLDLKTKMYF